MCNVCGCGEAEVRIEGKVHAHSHEHEHGHSHGAVHTHHHHGDTANVHDYGQGPAHAHAPGLSQSRMVQIETDILARNDSYARANRDHLGQHGILALNLVSSPGSGKTTLLTATIGLLHPDLPVAVIEGDQQTSNDADRIRSTGVPAVQINTGKGCHLDAHMVAHALDDLQPADGSIVFIENVGNLVCPAAFDLGEAHKVAILSVTEGEDKPIKYPDMFYAADLMILNKVDLLPHLDFDVDRCEAFARAVNPQIEIIHLSATGDVGMDTWCNWIRTELQSMKSGLAIAPVTAGGTT